MKYSSMHADKPENSWLKPLFLKLSFITACIDEYFISRIVLLFIKVLELYSTNVLMVYDIRELDIKGAILIPA
jgi:hypothetical protein